jgi:hypothetical protein
MVRSFQRKQRVEPCINRHIYQSLTQVPIPPQLSEFVRIFSLRIKCRKSISLLPDPVTQRGVGKELRTGFQNCSHPMRGMGQVIWHFGGSDRRRGGAYGYGYRLGLYNGSTFYPPAMVPKNWIVASPVITSFKLFLTPSTLAKTINIGGIPTSSASSRMVIASGFCTTNVRGSLVATLRSVSAM